MFVLSSDVTIGKFRFSGVNEVNIKRSLHSIVETAKIKLPSIAKIIRGGKADPGIIISGNQFNDGDPVIIKLGYNEGSETEFRGFVKRRNLDMPLEVECEGYSWLLRRNTIKEFKRSATIKELLKTAVSGLADGHTITVQCDIDFELTNIDINYSTGFDIINNISKYTDSCVNCFFIQPDVLWCGLIYAPHANGTDVFNLGQVSYRLGYNVIINGNALRL